MLEKICCATSHWKEDFSSGNVFLKYAPDSIKAYPLFVTSSRAPRRCWSVMRPNHVPMHFWTSVKLNLSVDKRAYRNFWSALSNTFIVSACYWMTFWSTLVRVTRTTVRMNKLWAVYEKWWHTLMSITAKQRASLFDIVSDIDNYLPHLVSSHCSFIVCYAVRTEWTWGQ